MSVSNGQDADEVTFNTSFISREVDSNTVGKVDLNNTDSASGDQITNIQKTINEVASKTYATQSIGASGTITLGTVKGMQYLRVAGSGGPQTASVTPFGTTPPVDGALIEIVGTDDVNTLELVHNDAAHGCILNGSATLKKYYILALKYDSFLGRYIEIARNF